MAQYEKRYNKGGKGNYDQGSGQRKPISMKPIVIFILLLLLCFIIFSNRELIVEKFTRWKEDIFVNQKTNNIGDIVVEQPNSAFLKKEEKQESIIEEQEEENVLIAVLEEEQKKQDDVEIEAEETEYITRVEETEIPRTLSDGVVLVKKPLNDNLNIPSATRPKAEGSGDLRKHKIERYVDQESNKYGLQDLTTGKILIEPVYDEIKPMDCYNIQPFAIVRRGKLWGVIDMKNEKIAAVEYDYINQYVSSADVIYISLNKDGKKGYLRMPEAKIVIPVEYEHITRLTNDYKFFEIREGNQNQSNSYGVIDSYNNVVLLPEYGSLRPTGVDGYIKISKYFDVPNSDRKMFRYGVLSLVARTIIIPIEYDELEVIGLISFIKVKKDSLWGCINDKNEVTIPIVHTSAGGTSKSLHDPSKNRVYMTLPNGERIAYNSKGQKVPYN